MMQVIVACAYAMFTHKPISYQKLYSPVKVLQATSSQTSLFIRLSLLNTQDVEFDGRVEGFTPIWAKPSTGPLIGPKAVDPGTAPLEIVRSALS